MNTLIHCSGKILLKMYLAMLLTRYVHNSSSTWSLMVLKEPKMYRAKEDEMEKSDARNERVLQILNELGSNDIPVRPVWGPGEHPTKVLILLNFKPS